MDRRICIKRIFDTVADSDGVRVLPARLWPRGITKREASVGLWARELAPSTRLYRWFGHEPARLNEFRLRYFDELDTKPEALRDLVSAVAYARVTLLYSIEDAALSSAAVLAEYLESRRMLD